MKKQIIRSLLVLTLSFLLLVSAAGCSAGNAPTPAVGSETAAPAVKESEEEQPLQAPSSEAFPAFTAETVTGETVNETVFTEKDLTVVNIWGTFCPPCIGEMPELAAWAAEMPDNVQILGIISDVDSTENKRIALAKDILQESGTDIYRHLLCSGSVAELVSRFQYVPTTLFVDREGHILNDIVIGAYVSQYKEIVESYLNGLQ